MGLLSLPPTPGRGCKTPRSTTAPSHLHRSNSFLPYDLTLPRGSRILLIDFAHTGYSYDEFESVGFEPAGSAGIPSRGGQRWASGRPGGPLATGDESRAEKASHPPW